MPFAMKTFVVGFLVIICCVLVITRCFELDSRPKQREFVSPSTNFRVIENSTVHIPCYLNFMEDASMVWYKNDKKIADLKNDFYDLPVNVQLETNHTLKISDIKRTDAGEYSCDIFYPEIDQPLRQSHHVQVSYAELPDLRERNFVSTTTNFRIVENSTIYIPCYLNSMENTSTIWFRNGQKIADSNGEFIDMPLNIHFERNYTLKISNIKRTDAGEYSCEILCPEIDQPMRQSHLVDVLYPATVFPDPESGGRDVELMQGFVLHCEVTGNPPPRIKWYFNNGEMLLKNKHIVDFNVSRAVKEHEGEYRCEADNSIGNPASASFQIRILYYPEVTAVEEWVHSDIGLKAKIACKVLANPRPKIDWFHDGKLLNKNYKYSTSVINNEYILIISLSHFIDFGNYSCRASNFLGTNYANIEISGLAKPAIFKADPRKRTENSYTLIWEVDSYSTPSRYHLQFRKQQRGDTDGNWISLIIPSGDVYTHTSPIHSVAYTLAGLEPAATYEATVSTQNEFGWSKMSKIFRFSTVGIEYDVPQGIEVTKFTSTRIPEIKSTTTDEYVQENALWQTDAASTRSYNEVLLIVLSIIYICLYMLRN